MYYFHSFYHVPCAEIPLFKIVIDIYYIILYYIRYRDIYEIPKWSDKPIQWFQKRLKE